MRNFFIVFHSKQQALVVIIAVIKLCAKECFFFTKHDTFAMHAFWLFIFILIIVFVKFEPFLNTGFNLLYKNLFFVFVRIYFETLIIKFDAPTPYEYECSQQGY